MPEAADSFAEPASQQQLTGSSNAEMNVVDRVGAAIEESGLRLVDVFTAMDLDRSKQVTADELVDGLRRVNGLELNDEDLHELVEAFDVNGDGEISMQEWRQGMENPERFAEIQEQKQRHLEQEQRRLARSSGGGESSGNTQQFEMKSALEEMKLRELQNAYGDIHTACWKGGECTNSTDPCCTSLI